MKIHQESRLRKGRYSLSGNCYAINKNVEGRLNVLVPDVDHPNQDPRCAELVVESLRWLHDEGRIQCLGYTVMPDHVHTVFLLGDDSALSDVVGSFSKYTARRINRVLGRKGRFWQHAFYERMVRDDDELYNQLDYIRHNPVRSGFVSDPEDWPWTAVYPDWKTP